MRNRPARFAAALLAALLLLCGAPVRADGAAAADLTERCTLTGAPADGEIRFLTDGDVETYAAFEDGLSLSFPESEAAGGVYIEWFSLPGAFTLTQYDASNVEIAAETITTEILNAYYPLLPTARRCSFSSETALLVSTIRAYGQGVLPENVHLWNEPVEKADLLIVSAHCDDELLYFGGTIPTYAGERGYAVQLAYMAHGERLRQSEAMEGLRVCGDTVAPVFVGFRDRYSTTLKVAENHWGRDNTTTALVSLIRRFRPEVVITHDLEGEYGHGAHRITASCMSEAVKLASDASYAPESAAAHGVWQVKKLYLHLYGGNPIEMNWRLPLDAFGGETALELANRAYDCHKSQQEFHGTVYDTGKLSSARFGLAFTTVGPDEAGGDFLEHIPESDLSTYVAPTPAPTDTPVPTPALTPMPTPEPTAAHASTPEPAAQRAFPLVGRVLVPALAGAIALGLLLFYLIQKKAGRTK